MNNGFKFSPINKLKETQVYNKYFFFIQMGGLDYLNKKVWHPGSMKNIQKVWEEEQKQKEINKKGK